MPDDDINDPAGDDDDNAPVVKYVPPTIDEYIKARLDNEFGPIFDKHHQAFLDEQFGGVNTVEYRGLHDIIGPPIKHDIVQSSDSLNEYYCADCFEYFADPDDHERGVNL